MKLLPTQPPPPIVTFISPSPRPATTSSPYRAHETTNTYLDVTKFFKVANMVLLNLLTFGLWSKVGRLTHYAFDAVIISAFLAGMKRSTGLTFKTEKVAGDNKEANKWINKYLGLGEWVMDQSVAIAGSSSFFERTR